MKSNCNHTEDNLTRNQGYSHVQNKHKALVKKIALDKNFQVRMLLIKSLLRFLKKVSAEYFLYKKCINVYIFVNAEFQVASYCSLCKVIRANSFDRTEYRAYLQLY